MKVVQPSKINDALAFCEGLLGLAIDTVGAANVSLSASGARDPKIVALALLSRTINNFKGAMTMVREGLVVEARTLTRCCYENLIWIAALAERRAEFVTDMLNDDAASRRAVGEITLKLSSRAGGDSAAADARQLRDLIKQSSVRFPNGKKLHTDKTALGGSVELAYVTFAQLSLEAVHPTITALGRHVRSEVEGDERFLTIDVVPNVTERDLLKAIWWCCDALLGAAVGANEILGGTATNHRLRSSLEELRRRSAADLHDPD